MLDGANWSAHFPGLAAVSDKVRAKLDAAARKIAVPAGTVVFGPGKTPTDLLLLVSGSIRVQQLSENGREIVLYRVHGGESCVMTTACLLACEDYSAEGIAETDVEAIAIPRAAFDDLMATVPEFRAFVFTSYAERMTDLFLVIEEIAFKRIDIRLAQKLLDMRGSDDTLQITHHDLAVELGTVREVVSRQLQEFARRGWVTLSRGRIKIDDAAGLEHLVDAD